MSKRTRLDFEGGGGGVVNGDGSSRQSKRVRCDEPNQNQKNDNQHSELLNECPICFEEFSGHIFQCQEGHLLCHACRPKFEHCPTCRISLSSNIRNRILEQILSTKTSNSNHNSAKLKAPRTNHVIYACKFCEKRCVSSTELRKHYHVCSRRMIRCPFPDCDWKNSFEKFTKHSKDEHHTCIGSLQSVSKSTLLVDRQCQYMFNHAIKFPEDTFTRQNPDFVWPKIVRFDDGVQFFVISRFNKGFITVFVRLMTLPKLTQNDIQKLMEHGEEKENEKNTNHRKTKDYVKKSLSFHNGQGEVLGNYWIEFRVKDEDKGNQNNYYRKDDKSHNNVPLRWPCDLYAVTVPFDYERSTLQTCLKVHHNTFTKYWSQENLHSSAILRFQFFATLTAS